MAEFKQQLLSLLTETGSNTLIENDSTVNQRTIPTEGFYI